MISVYLFLLSKIIFFNIFLEFFNFINMILLNILSNYIKYLKELVLYYTLSFFIYKIKKEI